MTGPVIPLVAFIIMCGVSLFLMIRTRHLERIARIEHGMEGPIKGTNMALSTGIFLCFMALGLFSSYLLSRIVVLPDHIFIPGFLMLFGGLGLIVSHYISRRENS